MIDSFLSYLITFMRGAFTFHEEEQKGQKGQKR